MVFLPRAFSSGSRRRTKDCRWSPATSSVGSPRESAYAVHCPTSRAWHGESRPHRICDRAARGMFCWYRRSPGKIDRILCAGDLMVGCDVHQPHAACASRRFRGGMWWVRARLVSEIDEPGLSLDTIHDQIDSAEVEFDIEQAAGNRRLPAAGAPDASPRRSQQRRHRVRSHFAQRPGRCRLVPRWLSRFSSRGLSAQPGRQNRRVPLTPSAPGRFRRRRELPVPLPHLDRSVRPFGSSASSSS